jgi:hypothetical protein
MKAGVLTAPNALWLETVPDPALSPDDLLIRVKAATVWGTRHLPPAGPQDRGRTGQCYQGGHP